MAPLIVEKSCLPCHADQGYKLGDILGGISISSDITQVKRELIINTIILALLACGIVILTLSLLHWLTKELKNKLQINQLRIEQLAITDELTGLYNRRFFFTRLDEELARVSRHGIPRNLPEYPVMEFQFP